MKKAILITGILIIIAVVVYFLPQYLSTDNRRELEPVPLTEDVEPDETENQEFNIEVLKQGTGVEAKNGDKLSVHYVGTLMNGTKFDSSIDRGEPFTFVLGQGLVITGWDLGLFGAKVGEKRKLTIPPELGYGETGTPGGPIPPNATLIFEVEVLGINQ